MPAQQAQPQLQSMMLPNTLGLPAQAVHGVTVNSIAQLQAAIVLAAARAEPLHVLGGGSNVVLPRTLSGIAVRMLIGGIVIKERTDAACRFEVGAGESWQGFVRCCIGQGLGGGIENLTLIPGTVGAAPIQNIGAYGVEVAEFIDAVEVVDRQVTTAGGANEPYWLPASDCAFDYRDSCFKQQPDRWVVSRVRFNVPVNGELRTEYAGITDELARMGYAGQAKSLRPATIAEAVARTRRRKLPDPRHHPNAGSFFKNPVLTQRRYEELLANGFAVLREVPSWQQGQHIKLSAAALIEQAGWKERAAPRVAVWQRQPLVLVNLGGADAADINAHAHAIRQSVSEQFGIALEQEPQRLQ